jgi:beta-fructofuranosidase
MAIATHSIYKLTPIGNVSWGHATSPDLITWTDVDHQPDNDIPAWKDTEAQSIGTTNSTGSGKHNPALYNHLAIFSGGAQPVSLSGEVDGTILLFYTGASSLPTAWNTPYARGTESQALAYSTDGGITWEHYENNPVISEPPGNWNITGWRDPYFVSWPELDKVLNATEPHFYAVFGSGIREVGPRMPLYKAPASNLTDWTFMGALWEPKKNTSLGSIEETGSYGFNFELSNFFSIGDRYFVSMGAEGGNVSFHQNKWSLWNEGTISVRSNGSIAFEPVSGGASDWGLLYAVSIARMEVAIENVQYSNSFRSHHSTTQRTTVVYNGVGLRKISTTLPPCNKDIKAHSLYPEKSSSKILQM